MDWAGKTHPLEMLAEWGSPALLAVVAGWAASAAGLPMAAMAASGTMALAAGVVAMRLAGRAPLTAEYGFEPAAIEDIAEWGELLLDDPLIEIEPDSRVVRLFARQDPTPGELVLRISDYLTDAGRSPAAGDPVADQRPVDASAALHAALANIRASLR